jgi:hypothetical protein
MTIAVDLSNATIIFSNRRTNSALSRSIEMEIGIEIWYVLEAGEI